MGGAPATAAHHFGKYSLVARLATGGMAEIFLARLRGAAGFEKLVCIKRILPHLAKDPQLVAMFLAEARIAAQISHPNVCQVFELGEIDGRYFIAMEYLEGVPFSCFRRRDLYAGHADPRLIAGLGVQACEGLHHAHQLKRPDGSLLEVVHRDVSSGNVFATVDGVVKVLDFGIAKVQDASIRTSTGSVKGTYAYMAPEQLRGERLDRRTDVFAVGIVLWELFARRHLFRRDTDYLTFQAITSDPIAEVAEFRPDVPPALSAVLARALSRDREARFPTARAFGEALAQSVSSLGGPCSASAIADEIARAFETRMAEQQALIRVAREGGVLDLDEDRGPSVGHGTAMITTPTSALHALGETAISPLVRIEAPLPVLPRSKLPLVVLVLLLLGALGAAAYFVWGGRESVPDKNAEVPPIVGDAASIETAPIDAAPIDVAIDATIDAAEAAPTLPVTPPVNSTGSNTKIPRPKPTGPPGYITIDATPWAVIHIDGKRYGETPLVQLALPPGKHSVKAVSPSGTSRTMTIFIESGKTAKTRRFEW